MNSTPKQEAAHHPAELDSPTLDELASHCFGCGMDNPEGLHLHFTVDAEALTATATLTLTRLHQGPPGYVHGGIIATLMDEVMSKLNRPLKALAMTRNLQVDYLRPSPLGQPLTLRSSHVKREGRKLFHRAELRDANDTLLAEATGLFIVIDPRYLA